MTLDERKRIILESIIKDYVETAEPVGSRSVVKKHALNVSAATVRNEMADLEEMGYLEQPHTSAGRIPSQLGYRYYVDYMMEKESLGEEEIELLHNILRENSHEWSRIVENIGHFMAQITSYTSFIIVPSVALSQFRYMQVVPIEKTKALVILVTDLGVIMHRKIDIPDSATNEDLQIIGKAFNRVFEGKRLRDLGRSDLKMLRNDLRRRRQIIDRTLDAIDLLLQNSGEDRVIISGVLNILNEPEFKDMEKLKKILTILEEDGMLLNIIPQDVGDEVLIRIGNENKADDIKEMSLVLAGYNTAGEMGRIGVIGPVRMEYWKAAGTVESLSKIVEDLIKDKF